LSRFHSTASEGELTSLAQYVERMKEGQSAVYFMTGENRTAVEKVPHLEIFKEKGYEVLILTDPIDEIWVEAVGEYQGHKFQSAAKGVADLGSEEERKKAESEREEHQKEYAALLAWMHTVLSEDTKEVRLSGRLTSSAACLVGDAHDATPNLEKILRAMGQEPPRIKRILEVNGEHPLVQGLRQAYEEKKDDPSLREMVEVVYGLAVLSEGGELVDPAHFSQLVSTLATRSLDN